MLFGTNILPGRGGLIGVLLAAIFMALVETRIRRFVPQSLDIIVTPTITLLITGIFTYVVFMPVGGFISDAITSGLTYLLNMGGIFAGFVLGATFLPLVVTGLHQGLTPIHMELINSIGDDPLLPILAMGGAGQVGAAFAIYMKTKRKSSKEPLLVDFLQGCWALANHSFWCHTPAGTTISHRLSWCRNRRRISSLLPNCDESHRGIRSSINLYCSHTSNASLLN